MTMTTLETGRAPQSLARRLLFPSNPPSLPPLLTSENLPPELNAELYDFIALALRAYIHPWWTKITRYDKEFLPHITLIITRVIHQLEARALVLDLPALVFKDGPAILTQHYRDYRNAASKLSSSYATGGAASLPQLFHHLQHHIALSPDAAIDLEYYRQIVDYILKACLPLEDFVPEAERLIIREVFVKVLAEDVIPKITQPWFIQNAVLDLLGNSEPHTFKSSPPSIRSTGYSFSFHTFIVFVLSTLQSFSGGCLALINAYKQARTTIKLVNQSPTSTPRSTSLEPCTPFADMASSPTASSQHSEKLVNVKNPSISSTSSNRSNTTHTGLTPPQETPSSYTHSSNSNPTGSYEDFASQPLILFSEMFLTSGRLSAALIMTIFGIISASISLFLDRLLPYLLYSALSPAQILHLVRLSKQTMFPNGYPGPTPIEPSPEEQAAVRRRLVEWQGSGGLTYFASLLLGADMKRTLDAAIEPLTCQQCNVHLTVILIDRVLVGLFPELVGGNEGGNITPDSHVKSDGNTNSNSYRYRSLIPVSVVPSSHNREEQPAVSGDALGAPVSSGGGGGGS